MALKYWTAHQLGLLRHLRGRFLGRNAGASDYWNSDEELALYDATFGARIQWKCDAAFRAAGALGWTPRCRRVLDWGCGSGVASAALFRFRPGFETLALHDRSARAVDFAAARARREWPEVRIENSCRVDRETLIVLSHVLNELDDAALGALVELVRGAGELVWIEPGTYAESRRLIAVRELLREQFRIVAPCPHQARCGLLAAENARHWCHHFAAVPSEVFREGKWAELGRELGIDLRSLPLSYLIMDRGDMSTAPAAGSSRILGVPRESKGYCRILSCQQSGVAELMLQKRDDPALFRELLRAPELPLHQWNMREKRIIGGKVVGSGTLEGGASSPLESGLRRVKPGADEAAPSRAP